MFRVKVGGVPEHFNYPWKKAIEDGSFLSHKIDLEWKVCEGGTGEMVSALNEKSIDLAIMLTEGSVKGIELGYDFKIIQKYIETPLVWGVHVGFDSTFQSIKDLRGKRAAISRFYSGSHLMSFVMAEQEGWDLKQLDFVVCKTLDQALDALNNNQADFLLWERYTTKPYVDNNVVRHIGNCVTPWPCFVIVTTKDFLNENENNVKNVLDVINRKTSTLKNNIALPEILSKRYNINKQDVEEWLAITEWSQSKIEQEIMSNLKAKLKKYSII